MRGQAESPVMRLLMALGSPVLLQQAFLRVPLRPPRYSTGWKLLAEIEWWPQYGDVAGVTGLDQATKVRVRGEKKLVYQPVSSLTKNLCLLITRHCGYRGLELGEGEQLKPLEEHQPI